MTLLLLAALVTLALFLNTTAKVGMSASLVGPPSPQPVTLKSRPPQMFCQSAFLLDNRYSEKLYGKNEYEIHPIASITKLLTALTFLDFHVDWNKEMEMDTADANNASRSSLRAGETFKVIDLFHASLMASDNRATRLLAKSTEISTDSFIVLMNRKADELGLYSIKVDEVTGLSQNNVANAADCARLLNIAAANPIIQPVMQTKTYTFMTRQRKWPHVLTNTNRLLDSPWRVEGGKTGHIEEAGWCFVARVADDKGHDLTAVVLGARSNNQRFKQVVKLIQWAFAELGRNKG